jgi:beta-glucosidase
MWDPELVQQAFEAAGDEMAFLEVNQAFTPVLDLSRDPRWGRTEETYGEDPYLVAHMGVAAINGLQGTSWMIDRHHVMATAKHFAAHGQPESGTNTAPANFLERDLRETFLVPFRAARVSLEPGQNVTVDFMVSAEFAPTIRSNVPGSSTRVALEVTNQ